MPKVEVKGTIVTNDDKWIYDWCEIQAVCPKDVAQALEGATGDVAIEINSGAKPQPTLSGSAEVQQQ